MDRPIASTISDTLSRLLETAAVIPRTMAPSLSHHTDRIQVQRYLGGVRVPVELPGMRHESSVEQETQQATYTHHIYERRGLLTATNSLLTPPTILHPPSLNTSPASQYTSSPSLGLITVAESAPMMPASSQASPTHPSRPPTRTIRGHDRTVWCAALSSDGKYMTSSSYDDPIAIWDTQTGNYLTSAIRKTNTTIVLCVAFSPDGRRVASGSYDHKIRIWDAIEGRKLAGPFKGHTQAISSVVFSSDGKQIASGSSDCTIRVWAATTGKLIFGPLTGHTRGIHSIAFSADGKILASGSRDKTVRTWNMTSGGCVQGPLRGHRDSVRFVAFSPDGTRIISAEKDGNVCVWDTSTGAVLSEVSKCHAEGALTLVFTPNSIDGCAVSPDGKWIAYRNGKRICISDSNTGRLARSYVEHSDEVHSLSFSRDTKEVISASGNTIQIYTLNL